MLLKQVKQNSSKQQKPKVQNKRWGNTIAKETGVIKWYY